MMTESLHRRRRLMGEINVVPYIDVMLVLLIIFMITAPLLTQGVEVELPQAGAEPLPEDQAQQQEPLVLTIDREGRYYLNIGGDEEEALDDETVRLRTSAVLRRNPQTPVMVRADRAVPYGEVMNGMVLLQEAGAQRVGLISAPRERDSS